MTSQLQTLTITEERGRIAREMHDSLAQILGYLNLEIQALEVLHQQGNGPALVKEFQKMRAEVQAAHADVRENILSLRTTLANEKGLIAAVEEYLKEFSYQTGIKTHFANAAPPEFVLSALAEIQLVCIMQEALSNVRKHAQAHQVRVTLDVVKGEAGLALEMRIQDDGVGFTASEQTRHFGLATMQERARGVDGQLQILSTPGGGAQVICRLPCLGQDTFVQYKLDAQQVVSHEYP
jgi:nitrate/nitrite-specific signal transduction histidine kinase